jgi:hypothetical protein
MEGAEAIAFACRGQRSVLTHGGEDGGLCDAGAFAEHGVEGPFAYLTAQLAVSADYVAFPESGGGCDGSGNRLVHI